jgi:hypothetical protein
MTPTTGAGDESDTGVRSPQISLYFAIAARATRHHEETVRLHDARVHIRGRR